MIQSTEIRNIVLQWYKSFLSGEDIVALAERLYSRQEGVLAIGTDPMEWIEGFEPILRVCREMAKMGPMQVKAGNLKAYSEGTVGWASDSATLRTSDGTEIPFRQTFVFHKEDGEWKIVQAHASIGIANEEAGFDMK